jgi:hypothetical protein
MRAAVDGDAPDVVDHLDIDRQEPGALDDLIVVVIRGGQHGYGVSE